jgi:hypothetical protein
LRRETAKPEHQFKSEANKAFFAFSGKIKDVGCPLLVAAQTDSVWRAPTALKLQRTQYLRRIRPSHLQKLAPIVPMVMLGLQIVAWAPLRPGESRSESPSGRGLKR